MLRSLTLARISHDRPPRRLRLETVAVAVYVAVLAWGGYRFIDSVTDTVGSMTCFAVSLLAGAVVAEWWIAYVPPLIAVGLTAVMFAGGSSLVGHDAFVTLVNLPFLVAGEIFCLALGVGGRRVTVWALRRRRGAAGPSGRI